MSIESVKENLNLVDGFLTPLFFNEVTGQSALGPEDFQRVVEGYACAACLAKYKIYLVQCPLCGHCRDLASDLEAPLQDHVDHLKERDRTEGMDTGGGAGFEEFMRSVNSNPDVDTTHISKLMKRKKH